jgi:hypothetical protein
MWRAIHPVGNGGPRLPCCLRWSLSSCVLRSDQVWTRVGFCRTRAARVNEYVVIEQGALLLTLDPVPYRLNTGDNIYYTGDCIQAFANPNKLQPCEYYLVMDGTGHPDSMQNRPVTSKQKVRLR